MLRLDPDVLAWMRTHRTTISDAAFDAMGITKRQRRELVQAGIIERVVNGAYVFAGVVPDEATRGAALCAARPELVIAGPTAGRHWRIRRSPRDGLVHVIAPPHSQPCREPWVKAYRTALIFPDEIVNLPDGSRVTSPPRTLVDLARYLDVLALASATECVLHDGMCTAATLHRTATRLDTPGRPWVRKFLRVLAGRLDGAALESDWEVRVVDALRNRGVADLECQVWERLNGYGSARFDIAIPSIRWVLEVDVHPDTARSRGADETGRGSGWADGPGGRSNRSVRRSSRSPSTPRWRRSSRRSSVAALPSSPSARRALAAAVSNAPDCPARCSQRPSADYSNSRSCSTALTGSGVIGKTWRWVTPASL
jgi:hypothetical protein